MVQKDHTERRNATPSAPPGDGRQAPRYRPPRLGAHQQAPAEQGDPNPDSHGIQARSRRCSGQQDALIPVTLLPSQPRQGYLQVSIGGGLALVRAASMQT